MYRYFLDRCKIRVYDDANLQMKVLDLPAKEFFSYEEMESYVAGKTSQLRWLPNKIEQSLQQDLKKIPVHEG